MKKSMTLTIMLLTGLFSFQANATFMNDCFEEFLGAQTPPEPGSFTAFSNLLGSMAEITSRLTLQTHKTEHITLS